ncbi:MAG: hypothetical protein FWC15_06910 [Fibromonadales bacterium]|nr:hypothetical protein [Fibromonadales bacterium]
MHKASNWNKVIIESMAACRYANMDKIFLTCENKLCELQAPEKEMGKRLFALAYYCKKNYNSTFSKTAAFVRFSEILSVANFERTIKRLIKKEDPALVVFWTIFRFSMGNAALERKIRFSILPQL